MARLQERYQSEIQPALLKRFEYGNKMEVPRPVKVTVNMGVSDARDDRKALDSAAQDMATITGQAPSITRARQSVANFRIRKGMPIGCRATLRGERMYEFIDRLVTVALPRIRDFRGLSPNSFDGRGNYSIGIREQTIFPEIDYDKIDTVRGLDITVVTTAETDEEAKALLLELGFPIRQ
ncbi:MAG: 50S ribosomal protein L5 [Armatimonadia bacterium]|nr:50S ribosomal protein L5 [Armatimonadia bacterium]